MKFIVYLLLLSLITEVYSDKKDDPKNKKTDSKLSKLSVTDHKVQINGKEIKYTVSTGMMALKNDKGKEKAQVFYIAYTAKPKEGEKRPITFSFNGGPGSSSVWMHLAMLAPRRVLMTDDGMSLPPPAKIIDNEYSILDRTDLIFIDPVSTGFSKPVNGTNKKEFHGVNQDISSVGEFIRLYVLQNKKWLTPKFLIGESYGTFRAAGLCEHLLSKYGMRLNGIMLISSILNFQTISFQSENDQAYLHFFPSYAATAWYHKKCAKKYLNMKLIPFLKEVESFTAGKYASALYAGSRLTEKNKDDIANKMSDMIGLPSKLIKKLKFRVSMSRYGKELLNDSDEVVGRFDSRYKGTDSYAAGTRASYDPSFTEILYPITTTVNHYLRNELKYENDEHYNILTSSVHPWDFNAKNRYSSISTRLTKALHQNPHMKIFIASGFYDLATPYFGTEFTFSHLDITKEQQKNIIVKYYEAGHMMYLHKPSLIKVSKDINDFFDISLKIKDKDKK
jgi:carboxypeptidase C (cathepsin A)